MKRLLLGSLAAALLGACATPESAPTQPMVQKEYRTGTSIPTRRTDDGLRTMTPEEVTRARDTATATMMKKPSGSP
jgi:hypothetical protein